MSKVVLNDGDDGVLLIVRDSKNKPSKKDPAPKGGGRSPVHVVYGGADLFTSTTPRKLGDIALKTLAEYAPDSASFAEAFSLNNLRSPKINAGFAEAVYERTKRKLQTEPVEDFRIDFEDGYGFRPDTEEDSDAERSARELAGAVRSGSATSFSGFRVRSYGSETRERAKRTLQLFLRAFLKVSEGRLPSNFVVTLPKVTDTKEVKAFCRSLKKTEKETGLDEGSIKMEMMVEHPLALIDKKGNFALKQLVEAADGRCVSAHFGAYDYTASLGIAASFQDIAHPACDFARQMMLVSLQPLGIRLSDSVTTLMPIPRHKGAKLTVKEKRENQMSLTAGWKAHFENIRRSMANGFYQSWDLHPNQLVARYAAVYSFYLETFDSQAARLRSFIKKATQATLTGHTFDDAASAMGIVNFLRQGLDCAALSESEIKKAAGVSAADLKLNSFRQLAEAANRS